jgi:hypothetical protein
MALNRGNYYDKSFKIWMRSPNGKEQLVWRMRCENCLARHDHSETKRETIECTIPLLNCLLQMMMNLSISVVEKRILSNREIEIDVCASSYIVDDISNLISRMCNQHIYWNISPEDANEIITRLGLSQYVFCVQGDPVSGACLVVLQELELSYPQLAIGIQQPRTKFRNEYQKYNESRTVVVTPAQYEEISLDKITYRSIQFTSVLPDGQFQLVFKRDVIQTVVPKIKKQFEIETSLLFNQTRET